MNRRTLLGLVACAAVICALSGWNYAGSRALRERAATAESAASDVIQIARQIVVLRNKPTLAGDNELPSHELSLLIHRAAVASGYDPNVVIQSIRPQQATRVPGSPYRLKTTELRLRGVEIKPLVLFLHHLVQQNAGLRIDQMQLRPTKQTDAAGWDVEPLVLSYLIYAPESVQPR